MAIPRFWLTLGGSLAVHMAVLFVLFGTRTPRETSPNPAPLAVPLTMGIQPVAVEPIGVSGPVADEVTAEVSRAQKRLTPAPVKETDATASKASKHVEVVSPSPPTALVKPRLSSAEIPRNTEDSVADSSGVSLKAAMLEATKSGGVPQAGGGFGSMEMLLKERRLDRALTWVFPKVISHDRSYWQLPIGKLGIIRFALTLDHDGKILRTRFVDANPEARLRALVQRMTQFLRPGRFAGGSPSDEEVVERTFALSVTYRRENTSADGEPGEIERIGFDAPDGGRPGRGYIFDRTGRELMGELKELPALDKRTPLPSEVPEP